MNEQARIVQIIGTALVLATLVPSLMIVLTYRRAPWRESRIGRVLFSKSAVITAVLLLSFIAGLLALLGLGRPWWFEVLRLSTFAAVAPVLWWQWRVYRDTLADATGRADDAADDRDRLSS